MESFRMCSLAGFFEHYVRFIRIVTCNYISFIFIIIFYSMNILQSIHSIDGYLPIK